MRVIEDAREINKHIHTVVGGIPAMGDVLAHLGAGPDRINQELTDQHMKFRGHQERRERKGRWARRQASPDLGPTKHQEPKDFKDKTRGLQHLSSDPEQKYLLIKREKIR